MTALPASPHLPADLRAAALNAAARALRNALDRSMDGFLIDVPTGSIDHEHASHADQAHALVNALTDSLVKCALDAAALGMAYRITGEQRWL